MRKMMYESDHGTAQALPKKCADAQHVPASSAPLLAGVLGQQF